MTKKRDFKISHFCVWGKELFQIKRKFREKNRSCVIKLCAIYDQLFQFVFFKELVNVSRFGLDFSAICFTVLENTFCPKYCVRISKPSEALLGPKNGTSTPSPSWISICLFAAKGELRYTRRGLRFEITGIWWRLKLMVCLISDLMFCFSFVRAKKPVMMPGYHYVDRKLDVNSRNKDYTSVEQCEVSIARHSLLGWLPFRVQSRQKYAVT